MLSAKPAALASASSGVTAVSDQDAHIWYTLSRAAADATKQNTASKPPAASGWIATRIKAGIVSSGYARQTGTIDPHAPPGTPARTTPGTASMRSNSRVCSAGSIGTPDSVPSVCR